MDCTTMQRWFSPYLDGLLAASERATLEAHVATCTQCQGDLDSLKQMMASLRTMETVETPNLLPGIRAQLTQQPWWERAAARFLAPWPESLPWHGLALAGSAALIVIMVVIPEYRLKVKAPASESLRFQLSQVPSQARQYDAYRDADRMDLAEPVGQHRSALNPAIAPRPSAVGGTVEQEHSGGRDVAPSDSRSVLMGTASSGADVAADSDQVQKHERAAMTLSRDGMVPLAKEGRLVGVAGAPMTTLTEDLAIPDHEPIRIQWIVQDRVTTTAQLRGWLEKIPGSTLLVSGGDQLVLQLPASQYPVLLHELAKYGTPASEALYGILVDTDGQPQPEAVAKTALQDGAQGAALGGAFKEPFVTVELTLTPSGVVGTKPAEEVTSSSSSTTAPAPE